MKYISIANDVISDEIKGIKEVKSKLDSNFEHIIESILLSSGRIIMCGMGKSGHIAKKIFSTLVSTGTPSIFLHPAEAFHGDLGVIKEEDIVFAISNSGETAEVTQLLKFIKESGNILISMTGNRNSTIAKCSNFHIDIGISQEACPLNLAPTTSTTASLVIGDAIAISLMKARNFKAENFARYHPGGSLGRKLLTLVKDVMSPAYYVELSDDIFSVLKKMTNSYNRLVLVGSSENLLGIITDGDIRRKLSNLDDSNIKNITAKDLMMNSPKVIPDNTKCGDADTKMKNESINSIIVINNNNTVLGIYDNLNRK